MRNFFLILNILIAFQKSYSQVKCKSIFLDNFETINLKSEKTTLAKMQIEKINESILKIHSTFNFELNLENMIKPDWTHYQALSDLDNLLKTVNRKNNFKLPNNELIVLSLKIENELKHKLDDSEFKANYWKYIDRSYSFFEKLEQVNKKLGMNIFPTESIKLVPSNAETIEQAEKLLQTLNNNFEREFEVTGHKNLDEYKKYAVNFSSETKKLIQLFETDAVVALHRPESARFWLPITGFQNQRTTGSSNGCLNEEYRNTAEASATNINIVNYQKLSVRFMPNYAEVLISPQNREIKKYSRASFYGSDLWIIKKSVV